MDAGRCRGARVLGEVPCAGEGHPPGVAPEVRPPRPRRPALRRERLLRHHGRHQDVEPGEELAGPALPPVTVLLPDAPQALEPPARLGVPPLAGFGPPLVEVL